jgi:hypothetical protein
MLTYCIDSSVELLCMQSFCRHIAIYMSTGATPFMRAGSRDRRWGAPVITIISPGATSRTRVKPMGPKAQSSLATHHSVRPPLSRLPSTNGLQSTEESALMLCYWSSQRSPIHKRKDAWRVDCGCCMHASFMCEIAFSLVAHSHLVQYCIVENCVG